jgi:4-amino-4-deoxy-L-arabinose transferase-like glycosyltransferase
MSERRGLHLFVLASVLAWTLFLCAARWQGAVWDDMLEAWAWGRQPQAGYYKHPPLYAWVTGAWFQVFPRQDWAFYLLSMLTAGIGYLGVFALARRFVTPPLALAAPLLLSFTPWTTYMASNFNANTILLAVWPWTAYAFVRTLDDQTAGHSAKWGALFGALAAAGLLSKYFSVLLLASCLFASFLHPDIRRIYRSPGPYVAVLVCMALCLPHAWWAVANEYPPIRYAMAKTVSAPGRNIHKAFTTGAASLLMCAGGAIALHAAFRRIGARLTFDWSRIRPEHAGAWIWVLACGPFAMTVALGLIGSIKIATNFMIPVFFMAPVLVVMALDRTAPERWVPALLGIARGTLVVILLAAPAIGFVSMRANIKGTSDVSPDAARMATSLWREAFGTPVRIANGTEKFSIAMPFYSADNPAEFTHFTLDQAPWITPARIKREGLLTICLKADTGCQEQAKPYAHAGTRIVERQVVKRAWGLTSPAADLVFIMTPAQ